MMGRSDTKLLILAAITVLAAVVGVAAQGRAPRAWGFGMPGLERLNLSDEQKADVRTLIADRRENGAPTFERIGRLERELQEAIVANPSDLETLHGLITRIAEAQKAQLEARVALQQQIVQILTPEQRQELAEFYASIAERPGRPRASVKE